ncbi:MAG: ribosome maturation factor RimM [Pseudomonadaceae bacterium]|nr:ribosome maturation factor RimM [Pseudomonadaceae bacterium]
MPVADTADRVIVVGRIGAPYGIKGWVNVQSFTQPLENLLSYEPWLLQASAASGWQKSPSHRIRPHKKGFVAGFEGVTDRDQAAVLTGTLIGVMRAAFNTTTDADEFYWQDLTGCEVINQHNQVLGVVDHLMETGVHDVLVVKGLEPQLLIPFVDPYVEQVDLETRRITVQWEQDW